MKPQLLCIGPFIDAIIVPLQQRYQLHRVSGDVNVEETKKDWAQIRGIVTGGVVGARREIIDALPALELIAINGIGTDAVDLALCRSRGIEVKTLSAGLVNDGATRAVDGTSSDMLTDDVADMAIGLLISAARGLSFGDKFVKSGKWGKEGFPPGLRVSGKRVGIFGLGRIGKAIARRCAGFDMEVAYTTRRAVQGMPWMHIPDILALANWSDFLVLAAPATHETVDIVDDKVLAALGPKGVLVNIARGSLVKDEALIAALSTGTILAAGLDVFRNEPKVPEAIVMMDNVALTPHQGSSKETKEKMSEILVKIVHDHFSRATADVA